MTGLPLDLQIMAELTLAYERQNLAECLLGRKGEHFDGDEWERRADALQARVHFAEGRLCAERGI